MTLCRSRRRQVVEMRYGLLFCWAHNPTSSTGLVAARTLLTLPPSSILLALLSLFLCDKASNGSAFRAPFQIGELARLHDPVRRLPKEKLRDPLQEPWLSGGVSADHKPRTRFG